MSGIIFGGGATIDLTAPPTSIGTTTPVAVNSTIFTALPANNTSAFVASGSSLTGANAQSLVNLSQTWNTTGTPTAIFANITDTASNAASLLMDLQVGGFSRFKIAKAGNFDTGGTVDFSRVNAITASTQGYLFLYQIGSSFAEAAVSVYSNGLKSRSDLSIGWNSTTNHNNNADLTLYRDAANTLAQRNSTNNQTSRLYKSFTDASNYTRAAWQFDANGVQIAGESAGTGDANIDITFTPKGTGNVRFGTHAAVAAEVITGYITIKDSSGTLRKLAVIS